jgi:hypothetical protein
MSEYNAKLAADKQAEMSAHPCSGSQWLSGSGGLTFTRKVAKLPLWQFSKSGEYHSMVGVPSNEGMAAQ